MNGAWDRVGSKGMRGRQGIMHMWCVLIVSKEK